MLTSISTSVKPVLFFLTEEHYMYKWSETPPGSDTGRSLPKRFRSFRDNDVNSLKKSVFLELLWGFSGECLPEHHKALYEILKKTSYISSQNNVAVFAPFCHKNFLCKVYHISSVRNMRFLYSYGFVRITCRTAWLTIMFSPDFVINIVLWGEQIHTVLPRNIERFDFFEM